MESCKNCGRLIRSMGDPHGDDWLHEDGEFRCFPGDTERKTIAFPERKVEQASGQA